MDRKGDKMKNIIELYIETTAKHYVGNVSVTIHRKLTPEDEEITRKIVELIQELNRGHK
jgi:hypothetical protein